MDKETENNTDSGSADGQKLAVVRIRGVTGVKFDIDETLVKLKLHKKNYCIVIPKNMNYVGMVKKVKDYVTWGNVDEETFNLLVQKKGIEYKGRVNDKKEKISYNRFFTLKDKKLKKFFRLNSPKKGYGRKGIKVAFKNGGALGYRGDKIKDLIIRMV